MFLQVNILAIYKQDWFVKIYILPCRIKDNFSMMLN